LYFLFLLLPTWRIKPDDDKELSPLTGTAASHRQWRIKGGGAMVRPPAPLWSDREFLDNFYSVFVIFVSRVNRKIRVSPKASSDCPCFLPVKILSKCTDLSFWDKSDFLGESDRAPALDRWRNPFSMPHPSRSAYGASPLSPYRTEILNTPLM